MTNKFSLGEQPAMEPDTLSEGAQSASQTGGTPIVRSDCLRDGN